MNFSQKLITKIDEINQKLAQENLKITCAESCTGGLLSGLFTEIEGSSKIFYRGFVTYSNQSKIDLLNVDKTAYTSKSFYHSWITEQKKRILPNVK